jgi:hypothetical protein
MSRRPKRPRSLLREKQRALHKLGEAREKLARHEPGGSPERPRVLESPAQVKAATEAQPCPYCEGAVQLDSHEAATVFGRRLRVVQARCRLCGRPCTRYYQLRETLLS